MQRRRMSGRTNGRASRRPASVTFSRRRQVLLAALAVVGLGLGYAAASYFKAPPKEGRQAELAAKAPEAPAQPWYKTQPPPPRLIEEPDAPILPEPNGAPHDPATTRAYEEALPGDVYDAPPVVVPAVRPPQQPAATPTPAPSQVQTPSPVLGPVPAQKEPARPAAWQQYALAAPDAGGRPMIAIVIDDLGLDRKRSSKMMKLPGPLTLSFLTYAEDLAQQTKAARQAGHELMLHVGMEPGSRTIDPGPNVLLTSDGPDEIRRRLRWGLERFPGFVGVNNHMGSKFTEDSDAMAVVLAELKSRGLLFLDSRTSAHSVGARLAHEMGVPAVARNVFLDNDNDVAKVKARLAEVERIARRTGAAVAIGHPRDATLAALGEWLPALKEKGLVLVPLTAVVRAALEKEGTG